MSVVHYPDGYGEHWFCVTHMRWAGLAVRISSAAAVCDAIVRRNAHVPGSPYWWFHVGARRQLTPIDAWRASPPDPRMRSARFAPVAWQPHDAAQWPHPLPAPLSGHRKGARWLTDNAPPPEPDVEDGVHRGDGWPYPGLQLGQGTPPASIEECEARVLRALRTSDSNAIDGVLRRTRTISSDIPAEMIRAVLKLCDLERRLAGEITGADLEAVRSPWMPGKRDIEDWLCALGWLAGAPDRGVRIMKLRAADPPFSYRQIADRVGMPAASAHVLYRDTVRAAWGKAREGSAVCEG